MNTPTSTPLPSPADRARALLGRDGSPPFGELQGLIRELKSGHDYPLAKQVLEHCQPAFDDRTDDGRLKVVWIVQQRALCTYKDESTLPASRFADALELLDSVGLREPARAGSAVVQEQTRTETLGLGGAIYKRMFEQAGQLEHLHAALGFYRAAWETNPGRDMGYGGVNAAFVLDLLASRLALIATRTNGSVTEHDRLRAEARSLREAMASRIPEAERSDPNLRQQYWYVVTLAEIQFGLGHYDQASALLTRARELTNAEWERQTTFRQFVRLARLQGHVPPTPRVPRSQWSAPWQALAAFLGEGASEAFSCWRGKVGLALSGGGFRASFFHLGVLARLAEMDVLPTLEALSTVSGGSIVGAHYYLELQRLLESKPDGQLTRQDFIDLVASLQRQFFGGVRRNLRTRVLVNLGAALKMVVPSFFGRRSYSRSHRIGELYEQELYSQVQDQHPRQAVRRMTDLRIRPAGENDPERFAPKFSNWRRSAKIPILLLNTTSLNSGHNWQFTASWLGEPPGLMGAGVDANVRYRRLYYHEAPTEEVRQYRLGHAVAGSACVPGLFDPLVIEGVYPGRTVRLVDGGVHDNQGVAGLLDESCTFILCSDASGQMEDEPSPSDGLLGVPLRMNSVLMSRVREAQYQDLAARVENRALDGLFFIHMKQGLEPSALDWITCRESRRSNPQLTTTPYGIDRDLQRKLAALRTDLDSFTEVEAQGLMLSGYLMTEQQFRALNEAHKRDGQPGTWGGFDVDAPRSDWDFLALEPIMRLPHDSPDLRRADLGRQLDVGALQAFKAWQLVPQLKAAAGLAGAAAGLGVLWLVNQCWNSQIALGPFRVGALILAALLALAGMIFPLVKLVQPRKAMRGWLFTTAGVLLGWIVANIHLRWIDPLFLKRGKVDRLLKLPSR